MQVTHLVASLHKKERKEAMSAFGVAVPLWALVLASVGCVLGLAVAWVVGVILVQISGQWARAIVCGVYSTLSGAAIGLAVGWIIADLATLWWAIVPVAVVCALLAWGHIRLFDGSRQPRY